MFLTISAGLQHFYYRHNQSKNFSFLFLSTSQHCLVQILQGVGVFIAKACYQESTFGETLSFLFASTGLIFLNITHYLFQLDAEKTGNNLIVTAIFIQGSIICKIIAKLLQMRANARQPTIGLLVSELLTLIVHIGIDGHGFEDLLSLLDALNISSFIQVLIELTFSVKQSKDEITVDDVEIKEEEDSDLKYVQLCTSDIEKESEDFENFEYQTVIEESGKFLIQTRKDNPLIIRLNGKFNTSKETLLSLFVNPDLRILWDNFKVVKKKMLKESAGKFSIIKLVTPSMFPIAAREFIFFETFATKEGKGGHSYSLYAKSLPKGHKLLRLKDGKTVLGSVKQFGRIQNLEGVDCVELDLLLEIDLKGSIPSRIISMATKQALPNIYRKMVNAAEKVGKLTEPQLLR